VAALPFRDEFFDVVTSVAAFEHFLEIPRVLGEVRRVLRSGGLLWTCIHIFTSPSGAHNITQTQIPLRRLPKGVEPWDHLRKRQLPINVPLNEWRIQQYLDAFAQHFEIVKNYCALREGEGLLSPQIESELRAYSREELTCGSYVIVAKKS
jgi:ubiquinone/menaquinone biosynthesis C-methylase UbiE